MSDHAHPTRRTALWLMAAGAGTTLLAREGSAQQLVDDPKQQEWTALVHIDGCPVTSANIHSIDIDDLVFEVPGAGNKQGTGPCANSLHASIRAFHVPGVRKEMEAWFRASAAGQAGPKKIDLVLRRRNDGGQRSYHLHDAFPVSFSTPEYSTESTTKVEGMVGTHARSSSGELAMRCTLSWASAWRSRRTAAASCGSR